jgi:hypothetical protein
MVIYVVTDEPYHENSEIIGVFTIAESAESFAVAKLSEDAETERDLCIAITAWDTSTNSLVYCRSFCRDSAKILDKRYVSEYDVTPIGSGKNVIYSRREKGK